MIRRGQDQRVLNTLQYTLSQARQAHAHILKTIETYDINVVTKILNLYSNNQSLNTVRHLLYALSPPTLNDFSTFIYSSSKSNLPNITLKLFSDLKLYSLSPDAFLLPSGIKSCAALSFLKLGQQFHCISLTSGSALDAFIQSSLIHFYLKCGKLNSARTLFDGMLERNVASCSALSTSYAKTGDVENALKVFNEMTKMGIEPNIVSWNGLIAGFNQSGKVSEAVLTFKQMHSNGFIGDGISFSSVLSAIGNFVNLNIGLQTHSYVIKTGFSSDKYVISAAIDMYGKFGLFTEMLKVFETMDQIDVTACNALITGLSRNSLVNEALKLFKKFINQGVKLDVVSWTSMISCCSQNGKDIEALELFREMQKAGIEPNYVTIPCLLPACGNIAALGHGKAAHCFSLRRGFSDNVYVGSALIDLYSNCGKIKKARLFFNMMCERNLVCWNAMMGGYAIHGKVKDCIEIFNTMQSYGESPDSVSFTSLLSACSQSGFVKEGMFYFNKMLKDYGIEIRREHYACIVSLLGRAGKLNEAYDMIKNMVKEPDACVWGALLSSCRVYNDMNLGEIAAKKLFKLEPNNPGNYMLLSNIYASKKKWKEVDKVRDLMKSKGLRKDPGCSWIEFNNKVHVIFSGDNSHPEMDKILVKLNSLVIEMKRLGYVLSTNFVLQDVEEQEKEHILCGHSEKLAVVLGTLKTKRGSCLSVIKNLRICVDCHEFMKFVSKFEGREICVRDTNRFHHFENGVCSCGDYW